MNATFSFKGRIKKASNIISRFNTTIHRAISMRTRWCHRRGLYIQHNGFVPTMFKIEGTEKESVNNFFNTFLHWSLFLIRLFSNMNTTIYLTE